MNWLYKVAQHHNKWAATVKMSQKRVSKRKEDPRRDATVPQLDLLRSYFAYTIVIEQGDGDNHNITASLRLDPASIFSEARNMKI